mgnify:CR=1 FL=1
MNKTEKMLVGERSFCVLLLVFSLAILYLAYQIAGFSSANSPGAFPLGVGLVMLLPHWRALAHRLEQAGVAFVMPPQVRFEGQPGEQWTMFFCDPFGNPIEVKGFASLDQVYAV